MLNTRAQDKFNNVVKFTPAAKAYGLRGTSLHFVPLTPYHGVWHIKTGCCGKTDLHMSAMMRREISAIRSKHILHSNIDLTLTAINPLSFTCHRAY